MQLYNRHDSNDLDIAQDNTGDTFDFEAIIGVVRRQWRVAAICSLCAILVGFAYVITAVPLYTASARVLIDSGNSQVAEQFSAMASIIGDDASVLSQVELIQSESIGLGVVNKLDLVNDPVFNATGGSIFQTAKSLIRSLVNVSQWFTSAEEDTDDREAKTRAAFNRLQVNTAVSRVGRTYILEVSYVSTSPELAARIANTIASEYLVDKLNSKYDATRRASDWLQDRIAELRQKALESDLAVQTFRTANGLVETGNSLISDQQLTGLNSAMIVAQSDTAKAQARYQRIQQIIASGQSDAIVTDALDSSVTNELRKKYLDASKLEAEISNRLGARHIQAVRLRGEMEEYKRLMFSELNRIAESYKSELDVARAREKSLQNSVADATGVNAAAGQTQVQLRELQREAETYKNLYQIFLQRYQEAVQQQSFPVTEARIISRASTPEKPSHPRKALMLALFLVVGASAGAALGCFREFRDRFFRTGDQVRDVLGLEFLGIAPLMTDNGRPPETPDSSNPRSIRKTSMVSNYVIDNPLSAFAEALRSVKIAADLGVREKECRIIGVVSTLPGEGKSTVSINLAELLASQGARTVLIDGDLRNPGATRAIARHAQAGLLEALLEGRDVRDVLLYNAKTKLAFLPAVVRHRVPHSSELLASPAMRKVLTLLASDADYIIVDLPPLGPVVDARAIAGRIDSFLFVTEWGHTARRVVRQTLANEPLIREKCLGVILNKVDQDKMNLYRTYGSSEYYHSRYSQYYQKNG